MQKYKDFHVFLPLPDYEKLEKIVNRKYTSKADFIRTKIREEIIL